MEENLFSHSYMHNQWATKLFGYEKNSLARTDLMSKVKREYSIYFTHTMKYSFDEEKIKRDFPYLFGIDDDQDGDYSCEDLVEDTIKALNKEIVEQHDPQIIESFKGSELSLVRQQGKTYIYQVKLLLTDGQEPHFHDGIPFILYVFNKEVTCEAVDFDYESGKLFFTTNRFLNSASYCRIVLDSTFIIDGLRKRLQDLKDIGVDDNLPFAKFLFEDTNILTKIKHQPIPASLKLSLDDSQKKAFDAAMDNDITFIWGPPGTGKSYTLASIIFALYQLCEERTVICCLSNVAVDQLLCKLLDVIDKKGLTIEPGNIYRAGRSMDKKVISTDYLFPNDEFTKRLRDTIKHNMERLLWLKEHRKEKSEESIILKANNKELREKLREYTDFLVKKSRVVFSTISNFILSDSLYLEKFDNLIVDEASMMAMPSLLTLGHKISKRMILVGDFQQLSPISIVKDHLLRESVFDMVKININKTNHPALHQLLHQRRSNEKIVELINRTFYNDKLIPSAKKDDDIINKRPFAGKVIALQRVVDGAVRFTKGGTRQNIKFAESVMKLLDTLSTYKNAKFTIGVITPYRGQVSLLRALMHEQDFSEDFEERIRIGTVHTFQGSESDIIIFDMVDCYKLESGRSLQIGKLFTGNEGERLINVAISRAKHKLIVVCDPDYIKNIPGNTITHHTRSLFNKLSMYSSSLDKIDYEKNEIKDHAINDDVDEWYFVSSVPYSKASKCFLSYNCRVVLSELGYYLEVDDEYIKLGDYPVDYNSNKGNVWIMRSTDERGLRIVHVNEENMFIIGYIREEDKIIVFTNPDNKQYRITFSE